jgi:hypothetical protein
MSELRQIDQFSQQLDMLQAEVRAIGSNLEATRQDHRVLDHKVEAIALDIAELKRLRDLLVGGDGEPGLRHQVEKLAQTLDRGRFAWRVLLWLGSAVSGLAGLVYYLLPTLHWGHK